MNPFILKPITNNYYNVAIVEYGSTLWRDNILIRDYLKAHPKEVKKYGMLKREIYKLGSQMLLSYSLDKSIFMKKMLLRARKWNQKL